MSTHPIKIKIKDIAEKSGVSAGTVDRVLHNRGNVSEQTQKRVKDVLSQINYTPNLYASALASKKNFVFSAVIPTHNIGEYWEMIEKGLKKGAAELSDFKVSIKVLYFDQFDVSSFIDAMNTAINSSPDGILLAPSLKPVTVDFTQKMEKMKIPYIFIDSHIEGTNPMAYYGQDSHQSGYLGAKLLFTQNPDLEEVAIFSFYHVGQTPFNQISLRMEGFYSYIAEKRKVCKLYRVTLSIDDPAKNEGEIKSLLLGNPKIKGAVIFSSRSYAVAEFLEKYKLNYITMIGYDLLDRNVLFLKKNIISYLIAQRPEEQAYRAIKAFSDHFIFKKQINRINYAPIDILTQENIDFYLEF